MQSDEIYIFNARVIRGAFLFVTPASERGPIVFFTMSRAQRGR
jgi:hypothetical protein